MKLLTNEEIKNAAMDAARYLDWELPNPPTEYTFTSEGVKTFARAIEAAILEKIGEPVGYGLFDSSGTCYAIGRHPSSMCVGGKAFKSSKLYKLPEVKE